MEGFSARCVVLLHRGLPEPAQSLRCTPPVADLLPDLQAFLITLSRLLARPLTAQDISPDTEREGEAVSVADLSKDGQARLVQAGRCALVVALIVRHLCQNAGGKGEELFLPHVLEQHQCFLKQCDCPCSLSVLVRRPSQTGERKGGSSLVAQFSLQGQALLVQATRG